MATSRLAAVFLTAFCSAALGEEVVCDTAKNVAYEPASVQLSGELILRNSVHPNGTKLTYPVLRLSAPINVSAGAEAKQSTNQLESCIWEVQLNVTDPALNAKLLAGKSRAVKVSGTLFHGHTAWHIRKIVMSVSEIEA